jgi:hypothetical protein
MANPIPLKESYCPHCSGEYTCDELANEFVHVGYMERQMQKADDTLFYFGVIVGAWIATMLWWIFS